MIGRDYPDLGTSTLKGLGPVTACISAGSDPDSPSFAFKGDKGICPNEDGLVILREGSRWLFAVADGHLGHHSSHALLDGLAALATVPLRLGPLSLLLSSADWLEETPGGTTLLVACLDETTGSVFGLSFGDSSLVTLSSSGARVRNELNDTFLKGGWPIEVERGRPFQFQLNSEETLLLYTDGVNECCYRDPFRSVKLQHLEKLYSASGQDPAGLARSLMDLALQGVDENPGGQDNIVLLTYALPARQV